MVGTVALKMKVRPSGLDIDLDSLQSDVSKSMEGLGAKNITIIQEPIAFGLKALVISCAWSEAQSVDLAENAINAIEGVSSCEVTDYRRAFG
jgi:elongation factor 1-beta